MKPVSRTPPPSTGSRFSDLFAYGMHNRYGVLLVVLTLISLRYPVVHVPYLGSPVLGHGLIGYGISGLLVALGLGYWGGVRRRTIRLLTIVALGAVLFQFYSVLAMLAHDPSIISDLRRQGEYATVQNYVTINGYSLIIMTVQLVVSGFLSNLQVNHTTSR